MKIIPNTFVPFEKAKIIYASAGGLGNIGMFAKTRKINKPIKVPDKKLFLT